MADGVHQSLIVPADETDSVVLRICLLSISDGYWARFVTSLKTARQSVNLSLWPHKIIALREYWRIIYARSHRSGCDHREDGRGQHGGVSMADRNIPTLIIDPVILFREGLRRILYEAGFQPVWCSDRPPVGPLPELSGNVTPLLIVGGDMEEAMVQIAEVKRLYPYSRQVLLLEDISQPQLVTAFRSGAYTLLLRRSSCEALIATLKLVLDGVSVLPTDLLDALLGAREAPVALVPALAPEVDTTSASPDVVRSFGLSTREYSVAQNLREGLSNKEIARLLGITEATVKVHVKAILRKARVRNRTQVAMWAARLGLEELPRTQLDSGVVGSRTTESQLCCGRLA